MKRATRTPGYRQQQKPKWRIAVAAPQFSDDRLASLLVECPFNLQTESEFGLLVGLWCNRICDRIDVAGDMQQFSFGFLAGELVVEPTGARISNQGRLEIEAVRVKITQNEMSKTNGEGSAGLQLGFDIGKFIGLAKAGGELGGRLNRSISKIEQKRGEQYQVFWRVADAGHNYWRVFGVGLNSENVLENKILGDNPLCHIVADGNDPIEVNVTFRCDLRDLWFRREVTTRSPKDIRFDDEQEERNRCAVAARILAVALDKESTKLEPSATWGTVVLAKQNVRSERTADIGL